MQSITMLSATFIALGIPIPKFNYCSVTGDNIIIGRQWITFPGGPKDQLMVQYRFKGYENALQAAGRSLDPNLLAQNLIRYIQTNVVTNVITPVELVIRKSA